MFLFGPPLMALVSGAACGLSCSRSTSGVVRLRYALPQSMGIGLVIGLAGVVLNAVVAVLLFFLVAYATSGEGDDWVTLGMRALWPAPLWLWRRWPRGFSASR